MRQTTEHIEFVDRAWLEPFQTSVRVTPLALSVRRFSRHFAHYWRSASARVATAADVAAVATVATWQRAAVVRRWPSLHRYQTNEFSSIGRRLRSRVQLACCWMRRSPRLSNTRSIARKPGSISFVLVLEARNLRCILRASLSPSSASRHVEPTHYVSRQTSVRSQRQSLSLLGFAGFVYF